MHTVFSDDFYCLSMTDLTINKLFQNRIGNINESYKSKN